MPKAKKTKADQAMEMIPKYDLQQAMEEQLDQAQKELYLLRDWQDEMDTWLAKKSSSERECPKYLQYHARYELLSKFKKLIEMQCQLLKIGWRSENPIAYQSL